MIHKTGSCTLQHRLTAQVLLFTGTLQRRSCYSPAHYSAGPAIHRHTTAQVLLFTGTLQRRSCYSPAHYSTGPAIHRHTAIPAIHQQHKVHTASTAIEFDVDGRSTSKSVALYVVARWQPSIEVLIEDLTILHFTGIV